MSTMRLSSTNTSTPSTTMPLMTGLFCTVMAFPSAEPRPPKLKMFSVMSAPPSSAPKLIPR